MIFKINKNLFQISHDFYIGVDLGVPQCNDFVYYQNDIYKVLQVTNEKVIIENSEKKIKNINYKYLKKIILSTNINLCKNIPYLHINDIETTIRKYTNPMYMEYVEYKSSFIELCVSSCLGDDDITRAINYHVVAGQKQSILNYYSLK